MTFGSYFNRFLVVFIGSSVLVSIIMLIMNVRFETDLLLVGCAGTLFASVALTLNKYLNDRIDQRSSGK